MTQNAINAIKNIGCPVKANMPNPNAIDAKRIVFSLKTMFILKFSK